MRRFYVLVVILLMGCQSVVALPVTPSAIPTALPASSATPTAAPTPTLPVTPTPLLPGAGSLHLLAALPPDLTLNAIQNFSVTPQGDILVATDRSFVRLSSDGSLLNQTVFKDDLLGVDDAGRGWTVNEDASTIQAWDGGGWTVFDTRHGWAPISPLFRSPLKPDLVTRPDGTVWLATSWDVRQFDGLRWHVFNADQMGIVLPSRRALATTFPLAMDEQRGFVWAGSCDWQDGKPVGGGAWSRYDGKHWTPYTLPATSANGCISALAAAKDVGLWVGMDAALWHLQTTEKTWTVFTPPPLANEMTRHYPSQVQISPDGEPWAAFGLCNPSGCGLLQARARLRSDGWVWEDKPTAALSQIAWDAQGNGWRLSNAGIVGLDGMVDSVFSIYKTAEQNGRLFVMTEDKGRVLVWVMQ